MPACCDAPEAFASTPLFGREGHSFSPEGTGRPMIDLCELLDILTESLPSPSLCSRDVLRVLNFCFQSLCSGFCLLMFIFKTEGFGFHFCVME